MFAQLTRQMTDSPPDLYNPRPPGPDPNPKHFYIVSSTIGNLLAETFGQPIVYSSEYDILPNTNILIWRRILD